MSAAPLSVTPAKAGVSCRSGVPSNRKTPAFAGVTLGEGEVL